jgi:hypothetical protein
MKRKKRRRTITGHWCGEQQLGMVSDMVCLLIVPSLYGFCSSASMIVIFLPFLGPPESLHDWTRGNDMGISDQGSPAQVFSRGHWRLVRCQNGMNFLILLLWFSVVTGLLVWWDVEFEFFFRSPHFWGAPGCWLPCKLLVWAWTCS